MRSPADQPDPSALAGTIGDIPAGRWAVGVSGGADSVALLSLLRRLRPDLSLVVAHVDHETRAGESTADAVFVESLARSWSLPYAGVRRGELERSLPLTRLAANASARYRAVRLEWFRRVAGDYNLQGVLLAHHADDQAETILLRLLRGAGPTGLIGMAGRSVIGGLVVLRPLLGVRRDALRAHLRSAGQAWREDASNASPAYRRNRVRQLLAHYPALLSAALQTASACRAWRDWARAVAPVLGETFDVRAIRSTSPPLAVEAVRRWLAERGAPPDELSPAVLSRLVTLATDAASPARVHFPGKILVRRRGGKVFVDPAG